MSFIAYATINSLEETFMIAGTDYTLTFTAYEEDGLTPADLGGAVIKWMLCPYGRTSYNILQIDGTITGVSTFDVEISGDDTLALSGKYLQQFEITSFFGQKFRPAQGVILISPAIPVS